MSASSQTEMSRLYTAAAYANDNTVPSLLVLDEAQNAFVWQRIKFWQSLAQTDVGNMADVVRTISTAAAEVGTGAQEISRGNVDLSQRTEEQASSLEETASSMEQMTAAVKSSAAARAGEQGRGFAVVASEVRPWRPRRCARRAESATAVQANSRSNPRPAASRPGAVAGMRARSAA